MCTNNYFPSAIRQISQYICCRAPVSYKSPVWIWWKPPSVGMWSCMVQHQFIIEFAFSPPGVQANDELETFKHNLNCLRGEVGLCLIIVYNNVTPNGSVKWWVMPRTCEAGMEENLSTPDTGREKGKCVICSKDDIQTSTSLKAFKQEVKNIFFFIDLKVCLCASEKCKRQKSLFVENASSAAFPVFHVHQCTWDGRTRVWNKQVQLFEVFSRRSHCAKVAFITGTFEVQVVLLNHLPAELNKSNYWP